MCYKRNDVTKEIKIKIMKELDAPKELTLSSICIVDVDEEINLWKVIERFTLNNEECSIRIVIKKA